VETELSGDRALGSQRVPWTKNAGWWSTKTSNGEASSLVEVDGVDDREKELTAGSDGGEVRNVLSRRSQGLLARAWSCCGQSSLNPRVRIWTPLSSQNARSRAAPQIAELDLNRSLALKSLLTKICCSFRCWLVWHRSRQGETASPLSKYTDADAGIWQAVRRLGAWLKRAHCHRSEENI
jgi:hypothetical protein